MQYFPPMATFLLFISFFDNGHVLGNTLQIQVTRMMEELLDLKEYFANLQKDIVNVRRDFNKDRLDKQTLIVKQNETICHCPREDCAGHQNELSSPNADEKYTISSFLNSEDLKKLDTMLKGLAKEKAIRINFGKKIDAMEETYGQNLSDFAMNIENVEKHIENRLSAKIKASEVAFGIKLKKKVSTIEQKLNESLSKLNQTIDNLREQIEKWRLDREALKESFQPLFMYWTAGNDIMEAGHWVLSPRNVPIRYAAWHVNEPNNAGGEEDCAELAHQRLFKMNDYPCENKIFFICEIERNN